MSRISKVVAWLVVGVVMISITGCRGIFVEEAPAPPAAAAPTIINNTPPSGGSDVLLALAGVGLLLLAVGVTALWFRWVMEKQRRTAAEEALTELTGVPPHRLSLMTVRQMRSQVPALTATYTAAGSTVVRRESEVL